MNTSNQALFLILKEGNPNSLGRLLEIFQLVVDQKLMINNVYELYQFEDAIVSMRVSNIIKRLWRLNPKYVLPLIPLFLKDEKHLVNPTFRWTLAQIFKDLYIYLSNEQKLKLINAIVGNLSKGNDWIMLVQSMDALLFAINKGHQIKALKEEIKKFTKDPRKVVKNKAQVLSNVLE